MIAAFLETLGPTWAAREKGNPMSVSVSAPDGRKMALAGAYMKYQADLLNAKMAYLSAVMSAEFHEEN